MLNPKCLSTVASAAALLVTGLLAVAPARADTLQLTSCHISGSTCEGGTP
jgi:hypothetical protein